MHRMQSVAPLALVVAACATAPVGERSAPPVTPPQATVASVAHEPVAKQTLPPSAPETGKTAVAPVVPVVVPPNTLYVCVVDMQGTRQQTAIEFSAKVGEICKEHPEMGPCKYERNACRRGGGRVFAADGQEITPLIEAEYDKRVLRAVFRSD